LALKLNQDSLYYDYKMGFGGIIGLHRIDHVLFLIFSLSNNRMSASTRSTIDSP